SGAHDQSSSHHFVIPEQEWSFNGIFGTYDRAALQRGFQVYKEVCSACHSMSRLSYRNLSDLGYSDAEVKAIAADVMVADGPNDEGEMFERPGRPSDHFKSPYANIQAAKYANNGAFPPDMSLLAKARHGGADYIYSILTGYEEAPTNKELLPGQYWNKAMAGNIIAMPQPIHAGQVTYSDGANQDVDQYARDVAQFLTWASEPHMEERKRTGVKVFLFLLVFAGVMYAAKRKLWSNVH
ncbi:MAG TPA: cytochrome c1, partial [Micavibrio sp.]